jgi:hypothetical protein
MLPRFSSLITITTDRWLTCARLTFELSQALERLVMPTETVPESKPGPEPENVPEPIAALPPSSNPPNAGTLNEDLVLAELAWLEFRKIELSAYLKAIKEIRKRTAMPSFAGDAPKPK